MRGGVIRRRRLRGGRERVDDLAGARVAKLFARFPLDGLRIGFQALNILLQPLVLALQRLNLRVECAAFRLLLVIGEHAVRPEDEMPGEHTGQHSDAHCRQPATP